MYGLGVCIFILHKWCYVDFSLLLVILLYYFWNCKYWGSDADSVVGMPAPTSIFSHSLLRLIFVPCDFTVTLSQGLTFPFTSEIAIKFMCFIQILTLKL